MKFNTKGIITMKKILIPFTAIALMVTGCEVDKSINAIEFEAIPDKSYNSLLKAS